MTLLTAMRASRHLPQPSYQAALYLSRQPPLSFAGQGILMTCKKGFKHVMADLLVQTSSVHECTDPFSTTVIAVRAPFNQCTWCATQAMHLAASAAHTLTLTPALDCKDPVPCLRAAVPTPRLPSWSSRRRQSTREPAVSPVSAFSTQELWMSVRATWAKM